MYLLSCPKFSSKPHPKLYPCLTRNTDKSVQMYSNGWKLPRKRGGRTLPLERHPMLSGHQRTACLEFPPRIAPLFSIIPNNYDAKNVMDKAEVFFYYYYYYLEFHNYLANIFTDFKCPCKAIAVFERLSSPAFLQQN